MSQPQLLVSQRLACPCFDRRIHTTSSTRQLGVRGGLGAAKRATQKRTRNAYGEVDPLLRRPSAPRPPSEEEDEDIFGTEFDINTPLPVPDDFTGITLEFQREQAKALVAYFEDQELQQVENKTFFGWTPENEIGNGRWVMFGILVGFITEYATGVSFWDQLKLMVTYLGIADIYDY